MSYVRHNTSNVLLGAGWFECYANWLEEASHCPYQTEKLNLHEWTGATASRCNRGGFACSVTPDALKPDGLQRRQQ